jgi:hypothetical protein
MKEQTILSMALAFLSVPEVAADLDALVTERSRKKQLDHSGMKIVYSMALAPSLPSTLLA